jgi:formyltetrahydrofolate deformylase
MSGALSSPSPSAPERAGTKAGNARLIVRCPDRPGIIAAISRFLFERGANIVESSQYSDGTFLLRIVFTAPSVDEDALATFEAEFAEEVAAPFDMEWRLELADRPKRVAIFVSRYDHCLLDLLWRARRGELPIDVGVVISNHPDLEPQVEPFGVPYVHIPVTKETKAQAEAEQLRVLGGRYDLVVLARYMQILTGDFLEKVGCPVINIHHSFLPAFKGAGPYERAKRRGVKLIGATAHYVTEDLDEGPIIEQGVVRVGHRDTVADLERRGADVERTVLSRAVAWHCEDRVLRVGETTVVL